MWRPYIIFCMALWLVIGLYACTFLYAEQGSTVTVNKKVDPVLDIKNDPEIKVED